MKSASTVVWPVIAKMPATSGVAALVPPDSSNWPSTTSTTGVAGSATAAVSAIARIAQPLTMPVCHGGCANVVLHRLPPPFHAVSSNPRGALASATSVVPPTAMTCGDDAG